MGRCLRRGVRKGPVAHLSWTPVAGVVSERAASQAHRACNANAMTGGPSGPVDATRCRAALVQVFGQALRLCVCRAAAELCGLHREPACGFSQFQSPSVFFLSPTRFSYPICTPVFLFVGPTVFIPLSHRSTVCLQRDSDLADAD